MIAMTPRPRSPRRAGPLIVLLLFLGILGLIGRELARAMRQDHWREVEEAQSHLERGRYDRAFQAVSGIRDDRPGAPEGLTLAARALLMQGHVGPARIVLERTLKMKRDQPEASKMLAAIYLAAGDGCGSVPGEARGDGKGGQQGGAQQGGVGDVVDEVGTRKSLHRSEENEAGEDEGDRADVEHALDGVDADLRGDGRGGAAGDEVGADEVGGAAEQGDAGESDDLAAEEAEGPHALCGLHEQRPAEGTQQIAEPDEGDGDAEELPVGQVELADEDRPVKRLDAAAAKPDERGQDEQGHQQHNPVFIAFQRRLQRQDICGGGTTAPARLPGRGRAFRRGGADHSGGCTRE